MGGRSRPKGRSPTGAHALAPPAAINRSKTSSCGWSAWTSAREGWSGWNSRPAQGAPHGHTAGAAPHSTAELSHQSSPCAHSALAALEAHGAWLHEQLAARPRARLLALALRRLRCRRRARLCRGLSEFATTRGNTGAVRGARRTVPRLGRAAAAAI